MSVGTRTRLLHTRIEMSVLIVVIVKLVEAIAVTAVALTIPVILERF